MKIATEHTESTEFIEIRDNKKISVSSVAKNLVKKTRI